MTDRIEYGTPGREILHELSGLTPLTLITGKNGTGKSTVLEALHEQYGAEFVSPQSLRRTQLPIEFGLLEQAPGIILIDSIEAGLHYSLYQQVVNILCSFVRRDKGAQVVAVTYSYEFIAEAAAVATSREMEDQLSLFRLERGTGGWRAVRYSYDDLSAALQYNMEVR